MNLQYLLASYFILMMVSLGVSIIIHHGNPNSITRNGVYIWLCVIGSFFVQGFVGSHTILQSLAMVTIAPTGLVLVRMQEDLFGKSYSRKLFYAPIILSLFLWGILYRMGFSFPVFTFGISLAVALPFFIFPFQIFRSGQMRTGSATCFLISVIISGLHLLDYPFLRATEDGANLGFMGAFITGFLMAVLVPVVIVENLAATYTSRLEAEVDKATADLRSANSQLQESQKENINLVHILCHDINNSLFVARSAVSTMQGFFRGQSSTSSQTRQFLTQADLAEQALANQADLISNVSMMQKVANKKIQVAHGEANLSECIDASIRLLQLQAKEKGISFYVDADPDIFISGDMNMLVNCVFNNIFSNAIKFSLAGSEISVTAKTEDQHVIVETTDKGVGMSEQKLHSIFSVEGMTSSKGTKGEMGSGFGMPIAKNVVEKMAGEIIVHSRDQLTYPQDHGTKVVLKLKLA